MNADAHLVIFDCDGVLVDSEPIACGAVASGLRRLGLDITTEEILQRYIGISAPSMYADIADRHGFVTTPKQQQDIGGAVQAELASRVEAIPGVDSAISQIATAYKVCVASSSSPSRVAASLSRAGLGKHFGDAVFSAHQVSRGKPAPDLFLYAAKSMGVDAARCCVIEDSTAGVKAAKAAGMRVLGFVGGGHGNEALAAGLEQLGADTVFRSMVELPALLRAQLDTERGHVGP